MKYKIVVDKQSRKNPSKEKREYIIDIPELHFKANVYDSLVITLEEDYVVRRFELIDGKVLKLLDEPKKEPLEDVNIELFEGENYIYLADLEGNKLYAEYLLKNDFTEKYVIKSELTSAIEQLAGRIDLSVNEKLEGYYNSSEIDSLLSLEADSITASLKGTFQSKEDAENDKQEVEAELSLKLDRKNLVSELNASADVIKMTAKKFIFTGNNFSIAEDGTVKAGGFTLGTSKFSANISGKYNYTEYDVRNIFNSASGYLSSNSILKTISDYNSNGTTDYVDVQAIYDIVKNGYTNNKTVTGSFEINTQDPKNAIVLKQSGTIVVSIGLGGINTSLLSAKSIVVSDGSYSATAQVGVVINGETGEIFLYDRSSNHTSIRPSEINVPKLLVNSKELAFPDTLYNNTSGTTGTLNLSKSIENYNFVEIYFADDYNYDDCARIYNNKSSSISCALTSARASDRNMNIYATLISISGSYLKPETTYAGSYSSYSDVVDLTNALKIKKVLGYV